MVSPGGTCTPSRSRLGREMVADGVAGNTIAAQGWAATTISLAPPADLHAEIMGIADRVSEGGRSDLERVLASQVVSMNAVFVRMLRMGFHETRLEADHNRQRGRSAESAKRPLFLGV